MPFIPLKPEELQLSALVDDEDYLRLRPHVWFLSTHRNGHHFAFRWVVSYKIAYRLPLHQEVLNFRSSGACVIDHVNGDPLDNRKANLRVATRQQNSWNKRPSRNKSSSKYKGIGYESHYTRNKRTKPWRIRICEGGKLIFNEYFDDEYDAYRKSQQKLKELHGEFAYLTPWTGYSNPKHPNKPINYKPAQKEGTK